MKTPENVLQKRPNNRLHRSLRWFLAVLLCAAGNTPIWAFKLSGERVQGGLLIGDTPAGAQIFFNDQAVKVSPQGAFIIGLDRDEKPNATLVVKSANKPPQTHALHIRQREYAIQRIDGLPNKKVSPNQKHRARIRQDNKRIAQARLRNDDRTDFSQGFSWPAIGRISGVYGSQRVLNGKPRRPHYGLDIAAPIGTAVRAPANGLITLAHPDMFFSGGTLILDHGHGLSSAFLHLDKIHVNEGDYVKKGDLIAAIGATGRVTGAHLDWRINWFKRRIDPQLLVPALPSSSP